MYKLTTNLITLLFFFGIAGNLTAQNPFENPSFESFTTDETCDRPDGWTVEDATTGYTSDGRLCVASNYTTEGDHSLKLGWTGNSTENKAAVWQIVDLTNVDTVAFDMIGPENGDPTRANVNVYINDKLEHECGRVGNNNVKTCKVSLGKYKGEHKFEIRFEQRKDDNLGNAAIDNVRPVRPCGDESSAANFSIEGPDGLFINTIGNFSANKSINEAFTQYQWYVNDNMLSEGQNFTYKFKDEGEQTVSLIVDHCFGIDTVEHLVQVNVPEEVPTSDFTESSTNITAPDTVKFTDNSSADASEWNWEITPLGDYPQNPNYVFASNTNANSENPEVIFLNPGTYSVSLTASNLNGDGNTVTKEDLITVKDNLIYSGDTISVKDAQDYLWENHGEHDSFTHFPDDTNRYRKILLNWKLGCFENCNDWDYTTKVEIIHRTGNLDTNYIPAPSFTVNGEIQEEINFKRDTTWQTFYNEYTQKTDSIPSQKVLIKLYEDEEEPLRLTNSFYAWQADYTNKYYDEQGNEINTVTVEADESWTVELDSLEEIVPEKEEIEIARVSTPYAGYWGPNWNRTWKIDVTEYAPILANGGKVRTYFRGNSSTGYFTINLSFDMMKGIPPRDVIEVANLWTSPGRGWDYGNTEDPISNHLVQRNITLPSEAETFMYHVMPNGHGFGGNQNCAEFCKKNYQAIIDGETVIDELMWRDDCGETPLYPQAGTWVYERANWCPGTPIMPYRNDITEHVSPGSTHNFDFSFDPYTYDPESGGTKPRWVLDVQVLSLSDYNFDNDVEIEEIIAPNMFWEYNRYNPSCGSPIIKVRNTGGNEIDSITFEYGIEDEVSNTYTWTGHLNRNESTEIELPPLNAQDLEGEAEYTFEINAQKVNDADDEYEKNSNTFAEFITTSVLAKNVSFNINTNHQPMSALSSKLEKVGGDVIFEFKKGDFEADENYELEYELEEGCYNFYFENENDIGLDFWAVRDDYGSGNLSMSSPGHSKSFESDFGTFVKYQFRVGTKPELQLSKDLINFGFIDPGNSVTKTMVLKPGNDKAITINELSIFLGEVKGFTIESPQLNPEGEVIEPGDSLEVEIKFEPKDSDPVTAVLKINSNDIYTPTHSIDLYGNTDINNVDILTEKNVNLIVSENPINESGIVTVQSNGQIRSNVILSLYNNLGNEVKTIYNGVLQSSRNEFNIEASDLSSGVYHLVLDINGSRMTKKVVIMR